MRSKLYIAFILIFIFSCGQKMEKSNLTHLTGYWEIKTVVFPDGTKKEYPVNLNIDFFQLDNLKGYRKKMKPSLDGTYTSSTDTQEFSIQERNDVFTIYYENELDEWSEKLIAISKESLIIENSDGLRYIYARFHPLNLNP